MNSLAPIVALTIFVVLFGTALLFLVSLVGPKPKNSDAKSSTYECGIDVQTTGHSKISVRYYLTAILFILFDIEIIFMYPWAIAYGDFIEEGKGLYMLGAMGVFLLIFIIGLVWEIKSKALEWD